MNLKSILSFKNKNLLIMLFGNIFTLLITILLIKILTNNFTKDQFGIYSLIISFSSFLQIFLYAPISASIVPLFNNEFKTGKLKSFQKNIFTLLTILSIILLFFFIVLKLFFFIDGGNEENINMIFSALLFSITSGFLVSFDSFSLANSNYKYFTFIPLINLSLKLLFICILFIYKLSPVNLIIGISIIQFIFIIAEYFFLKNRKILTIDLSLVELLKNLKFGKDKIKILNYSKNYAIWGFFGAAAMFLDKFFINFFGSASDVAVYTVYFQYGFIPFTVISSVISQYISPIYFNIFGEKELEIKFLKSLFIFLLIYLFVLTPVLILVSFYVAPFLIETLSNSSFLTEIKYFPLIIISGCLFLIAQILFVPLSNVKNVKKLRLPKIISPLISIVLFYFLINSFGILGAFLSLIISNAVYFFYLSILNYNYLKSLIKNA